MFQHFWGTGETLKPGNFVGSLVASLVVFPTGQTPGYTRLQSQEAIVWYMSHLEHTNQCQGSLTQWYRSWNPVPLDHHGIWWNLTYWNLTFYKLCSKTLREVALHSFHFSAFNSARTGLTTLDNSWKRIDTHLLVSNISHVLLWLGDGCWNKNYIFLLKWGASSIKNMSGSKKNHLCKFPRPCSPGWSVRSSNSNHQSSTL